VTRAAFKAAVVQMVSTPNVEENLAAAARLVAQAAGQGAKLVALPEYFCVLGMRDRDKVAAREKDGAGPIQDFLAATAARHGVWLVGGSVPLGCADPGKVRNSCLVYDAAGARVARYDKMHLFGLELGDERFDESATIEPGTEPRALDSPFGRIALSVCYDLRFPELYRILAVRGARVIAVPAAFTLATTRDHWETLLRARAIENQAFVVAANQVGAHPGGHRSGGRSMIVDPWGVVLAQAPDREGHVLAELDLERQLQIRSELPSLANRRPAAYRWPDEVPA